MFTGIIETAGVVRRTISSSGNLDFWIESSITSELRIDQSIAHNGVCLTVVEISGDAYRVTAIAETLAKTALRTWREGSSINLERSLRVGDRLDGHFVQGHIDAVAECISKESPDGSWLFRFRFPPIFAPLIVEKGSVCVDGVSLTAFGVSRDTFTVAIIPYTYKHTGFNRLGKGSIVNIEFDVMGKYFLRGQQLQQSIPA